MDTTAKTDLIPQFRELRKPYFLYRTPDALGTYLTGKGHKVAVLARICSAR